LNSSSCQGFAIYEEGGRRNERAKEGLNPRDGGDDFLTPLNMTKGLEQDETAGKEPQEESDKPEKEQK